MKDAVGSAKHSNQQKDLYATYRQAVLDGKASFTLKELNNLYRSKHWYN